MYIRMVEKTRTGSAVMHDQEQMQVSQVAPCTGPASDHESRTGAAPVMLLQRLTQQSLRQFHHNWVAGQCAQNIVWPLRTQ